jgi:ABC-type Fe3+-hydroxamate transport system substrate-binding protein
MIVRDARGREHRFDAPPRRVISLVPSLTETLFDLGAGDDVIGITDFCIFPEGLALPRVGGTKNPRVAEIRALRPDLVHMNLEENLRRHAEEIEAFAPVFVSEPKSVDDVAQLIATLAAIHAKDAGALLRDLDAARFTTTPFTFAVPIWKSPWMWCGGDTYVSALVESIGGRNALRGHERYPSLAVDEVLALGPDVVFLPDEPYAFTADDALELRGPRVVGPFPGHLFTWHGSRTALGLRFLGGATSLLQRAALRV